MNYSFCLAKPSDAEEMLHIYGPYVQNTTVTFEYDIPTIEQFQERVETITSKFPWIVCRIDGKIAGYCYANFFRTRAAFHWSVETSIYISKKYQGKHIATMLYDHLTKLLTYQGFHHMYAFVSIPNPSSEALHKKLGFQTIGIYEKSGFKHGKWCDLMALHKPLKASCTPTPIIPITDIADEIISQFLS